ncbi:MAG: thiol-disulfide isomerase/thioredoxin [Sulfurimonas sp.]|jgi:thiol-disulfide isomerase/thioredoxin
MKIIYTLFTFFAILVFTGCSNESNEESSSENEHATIEQESYTIKDISGKTEFVLKRKNGGFIVEGHEDKIVIFDMYATYCPPCAKEAPRLTDLQMKYSDKLLIIALNTYEEVTDLYIDESFRFKYGAFYFISNSKHNEKIINTLLRDIGYKKKMQIPFKVVLKNSKYQKLTDIYYANPNNNFYLGAVNSSVIEEDIKKILEN